MSESSVRLRVTARVWWITAGLIVALSVAITSLVTVVRGRSSGYACLRFDSEQANNHWMVDLNTGLYVRDARPAPSQTAANATQQFISADGSKLAYLRPLATIGVPRHNLAIKASGAGTETTVEDDKTIFAFAWAPNSSSLAYAWRDQNGLAYLTFASADGSNKRTKPLATARPMDIMFHGWAADSTYVALSLNEALGRTMTFWSPEGTRAVEFALYSYLPYVESENVIWSPQGRRLAYLRSDLNRNTRLIVNTPGPPDQTFRGVQIMVDLPYLSNARVFWSPDANYLSVRYSDQQMNWQLLVYHIAGAGMAAEQIASLTQGNRLLWPQGAIWVEHSLVYWQQNQRELKLMRFDVMTGKERVIQRNVQIGKLDPLAAFTNPQQAPRVALAYREDNGTVSVDLIALEGGEREPLLRGVRAVHEVYWSPDRTTFVIRWSQRNGLEFLPRFTWMRDVDGKLVRYEYEDQEAEVSNVHWLNDNGSLVYVAERNNILAVEVMILATGQRHALADNLTGVTDLKQDADTGRIIFWWRKDANEAGISAYLPDGQNVYQFRTAGSIENGALYASPDEQRAVLVTGQPNNWTVNLATADGAPARVLRTGVIWSSQPRWSPDSARFAFARGSSYGDIILEIFNADGQRLRLFNPLPGAFQNLTWIRCG